MIQPLNTLWFAPFFLYAETHYRFRYFFSLLRKKEPEIIADLPHRIEPGSPLPLMILAKDGDRFPCRIDKITVELRQESKVIQKIGLLEIPTVLNQKMYWRIFTIPTTGVSGWIDVDVEFHVERNGTISIYHNDNHITSSRQPLRTFVSKDPLPCFPGLVLGDPHTHSDFTDDQVEFGSPMAAGRELSRAMGLSYFCVTDHSYDLDDRTDSYLEHDPKLPKWRAFQREVDELNSTTDDFVVVRGEEVSCRNKLGQNVHFLLFGQREFVPGSGDGAERWMRTRSELSIPEVLDKKSIGAVAFAAHAQEPVPMIQRALLGRGFWSFGDLEHDALAGLQLMNGRADSGFVRSYKTWIKLLLAGRKIFAIAGNDAHGNFNRYRQVGFPFLFINEHHNQLFGKWRTGIFIDGKLGESELLAAMGNGRLILTDGPIVRISAVSPAGQSAEIGDTITARKVDIFVAATSSEEFGKLASVAVFVGKKGDSSEKIAFRFDANLSYSWSKSIPLEISAPSYVRVEISSSAEKSFDRNKHFCYTNPIWIQPSM